MGAFVLLKIGKELGETRGDASYGPAYAAAGGTVGTIAGAAFALLTVMFVFSVYRSVYKKKLRRDRSRKKESFRRIYHILLLTIAPVILSATVYNISDFLDTAIFNNVMAAQGYQKTEYASFMGIFNSQYNTLVNVPLSVSSALAASLIPSLVTTVQTGSRKQVHNKITMVTRFNMMIAIPCAVGFLILAKPIMDLLFYAEDNKMAALMLQLGAISVIFFCLSTVTNSVLQGLDDMMTPVRNAAISLLIHTLSLLLMLVVFKWNIYAVVISKIVFSGAICILNAHALRERIGYVQEQKQTFIIPICASGIMGAVTVVVHLVFELFAGAKIATVAALFAAVAAYGVALVLLGGVTEEEMQNMPKGRSLAALCRKLHLFRD